MTYINRSHQFRLPEGLSEDLKRLMRITLQITQIRRTTLAAQM